MHDGYIFSLGICGSAAASGPAPHCLNTMLAALPPVKRAAYLGEVLVSVAQPSITYDPLLGPVCAELVDAEVLLLATPLPGDLLPPRLHALAQALEAAPPPTGRRFAILVVFADGPLEGLWPLRHALETAGIEILGELYAPNSDLSANISDEAVELACYAYARARATRPEALP